MRLVPNNKDELLDCLNDVPEGVKVEADADTGVTAATVKDLRTLPSWPGGLIVEIPRGRYSEQAVKISRAN